MARNSPDYRECCLCRRVVHRDEAVVYTRNHNYQRRVCLYCVEKLNAMVHDLVRGVLGTKVAA